jgi:hypothetical protein
MPGPGPYGNKKPAAQANQERRRRIATKVARKQSRLLPNKILAKKKRMDGAYKAIGR